MKKIGLYSVLFILFLSMGCSNGYEVRTVESIYFTLNPSGYAPLTALVNIETRREVFVDMRVIGKKGVDSDIEHRFLNSSDVHELEILGLYPDHINEIEFTFYNRNRRELGKETLLIETEPLISDMPFMFIRNREPNANQDMHLVNYMGHDGNQLPTRPFMCDNYGDIRWYLDYSQHETLASLRYDNGLGRLENGNLIFGDRGTDALYEVNMFGEIQNTWELENFGFHHHVIEKPNGNLIVTVDDFTKNTFEDVIVELDRTTGEVVNKWDLTVSLDPTRTTWDTDLTNIQEDWFHANGLFYDESDNTLIVSGRTQGVVKLTENNEVVWILAPHKGWGTAGNGTDLTQFLLQPLDASGNPISDQQVLDGDINHSDFEWAWYQHSPILLPNGNLAVFDNGDNRNYTGNELYSRAVEFKIDETNKTIQQVWQYGKERGEELYSRIVSKVFSLDEENTIYMSSGAVQANGNGVGKLLEIDKNNNVIFEADVVAPQTFFIVTLHNAVKMPLY